MHQILAAAKRLGFFIAVLHGAGLHAVEINVHAEKPNPKGALQNILLQIMRAGDAGIAQHTVTGFLQHGIPFSIFFFLADVAGIIQFNNHDHAAVFIQQHKVGHLAVELIAYFIVLIGDECAECHLR